MCSVRHTLPDKDVGALRWAAGVIHTRVAQAVRAEHFNGSAVGMANHHKAIQIKQTHNGTYGLALNLIEC